MNKQPYLTSFPQTVIANSARHRQAEIRRQRSHLIKANPSGYCAIFEDTLPASFLQSIDTTARQRHFGLIPTFWAWFSQILEGNASCSKAIGFVQSWCSTHGLPAPVSDTSAYCKARKRMKDEFLHAISRRVLDEMQRHQRDEDCWKGMTLKAIDGSSVKLTDTPANQGDYPQPSAQKPGCGFPVMGISGLLNLSHGGWEAFHAAENSAHDLTMAEPLLKHLAPTDLLLADRAFCSYRFIDSVRKRGAHALMRLHSQRESSLDWRRGRHVGPHQRLVTWKRPMFANVSHSMTREQWEAMPEEMEVRLIRLSYEDRYGRKRKMTVVTTLTDIQQYDGVELHQLYARRWEIELRLREIKTTMGFEFLRVRTPEMAHKTLMMLQVAYNLIRIVMQRAARVAERPLASISFKGMIDLLTTNHESFRQCAGRPRKRARRMLILVDQAAQRLLPYRPYRLEPRALKERRKPFALLTAPRHEFIEIPHRSEYRAFA